MITLQSRLDEVVGRVALLLDKAFGMRTVGDLLRHYPRRLAERGELTDLASLRIDDDVTVLAEVHRSDAFGPRGHPRSNPKGQRLVVVVGDGRGSLDLVFFGSRNLWRAKELVPGVRGLFSGKVGIFNGRRQLAHPEYLLLRGDHDGALDQYEADGYAGALIPVYPATKEVRTWTMSKAVGLILEHLDPLPDPVPLEIVARHGLVGFDAAIRSMHRPETRDAWYAARRRLAWDEALGVQLALAQRRAAAMRNPAIARPPVEEGLRSKFEAQLPFTLTRGQLDIGDVLEAELNAAHPMHRLLQGEVGSGKTVVALRAMLQVVDAGGQAALLAPTEVLAQQHARSIETLLGPLAHAGRLGGSLEHATRVALLTGSLPAPARKAALLDAASGAAGIVVGTHALIQQNVSFADLGLVVIDEQHRFGVEQRDALRSKSRQPPHLLVMTATPIPRTVAMTVFGDLETSTLTEMPVGRSPVSTTVIPLPERPAWLERAWQRIREEVAAGHQAFIVCPRIGDGGAEIDMDADDVPADVDVPAAGALAGKGRPTAAVINTYEMLTAGPLAGLEVAALHGRLAPDEKDRVMSEFAAGRLDVLVATTVIEVGVDVPNAVVMTVLDAERFGVSQLHQLRGRVGRGPRPGVCLLVTNAPADSPARARLEAVAATADGFELARLDVEQRREGDVLGARQSGSRSQLRLLSLLRDEDLIVAARGEASDLIAADPDLLYHPLLGVQVADLVAEEQAEYLEKA
ncbi:MAG: ATP-dependent DNA helicase RecG [Actinomycetota bacterium]|nr:ATP-dependent DNA helicase RecG [Actinomycetota bacterium]